MAMEEIEAEDPAFEGRRSTVIWIGVVLSLIAVVLAIAWTFVPATVTYEGREITCHPASVDRSSPAEEVDVEDLACRPTADLRQTQQMVGLAIALGLIWGPCGLLMRKRSKVKGADDSAGAP